MRSSDPLTRQIVVRLSEGDMQRLEALVARVPIGSRTGIARAAFRLGLATLEADPTKLVEDTDSSAPEVAIRGRKARQQRGRK